MYLHRVYNLICLLICCMTAFTDAVEIVKIDNPEALQIAREFPSEGTLKQNAEGFVYIDIQNELLYRLLPFIQYEDSYALLPDYFDGEDRVGAHITVMTVQEVAEYHVSEIKELNQQFPFEVLSLSVVELDGRSDIACVWILDVQAPLLDELRMHYGLPPKSHEGVHFHITLAVTPIQKVYSNG